VWAPASVQSRSRRAVTAGCSSRVAVRWRSAVRSQGCSYGAQGRGILRGLLRWNSPPVAVLDEPMNSNLLAVQLRVALAWKARVSLARSARLRPATRLVVPFLKGQVIRSAPMPHGLRRSGRLIAGHNGCRSWRDLAQAGLQGASWRSIGPGRRRRHRGWPAFAALHQRLGLDGRASGGWFPR